jgi:hypothetical protein
MLFRHHKHVHKHIKNLSYKYNKEDTRKQQ